ncbi:DUF5662 family protein [Aeoliella mucimassa]|uniref:Uncharacterized protein n=1 Tax=Aeoliella mucimassa TaxID=2527972 RepID=A0A518AKC7_9BACT|nr:DUF5662 family protein [Aeoliella mucimassa]QDU55182.1 hypothetical protein Pan181_13680 [Aeoliella mucimassa]
MAKIFGMDPVEPTPSMIAFFEQRTRAHIARVERCLQVMARVTPYGEQLLERAARHDASKFEPEERVAYIWLTEHHRRRKLGEAFTYPSGVEPLIESAIAHHMSHNRHHPEFHADPNDMTEVDLIEMVCDWTAMAQEFQQCGGSAREWADRTVGQRVQFNAEKSRFVYEMIALLDRELVGPTSD